LQISDKNIIYGGIQHTFPILAHHLQIQEIHWHIYDQPG